MVGNAQFVVQHRSGTRCADRDLVRVQIRGADRDADLVNRGGHVAEFCMQNAGARLDREATVGRRDPGALDEVFGETAEAVAAHLAVGAVGVDDRHAGGGGLGVLDEQDAVGADPEVPVADSRGGGGPVELQAVGERAARVDQHEVVACALDFEKWNRHV